MVNPLKVLARIVILATHLRAAMEIHVILPAIPCLVLIRESRIKLWGFDLAHVSNLFGHGGNVIARCSTSYIDNHTY